MGESLRKHRAHSAAQRRAFVAGILLLLALTSTTGCSLLPKEEEALLPPLVPPQQQRYELHELKRGTLEKKLTGRAKFESRHIVDHRFQGASGRITAVHVARGDRVKKGDPLIELEQEDLTITLLERERDVLAAEIQLEAAKSSRNPALVKLRNLELEIAEQERNEVKERVKSAVLSAEIDGIIAFMERVKPGDIVQNGLPYLTIMDPEDSQLSFRSTAPEMREAAVGMKAQVVLRDQIYDAVVTQSPSTAPIAEDPELQEKYANTLFLSLLDKEVEPDFQENPEVTLSLLRKDNVLIVPRHAVHTLFTRHYVRVLDGERVKELDIEKGIETTEGIEIVSGLEEGMMVILP